jgi:prepilin-type N-terminal cleavage/methylation domain-containing protein
MERTKTSGFTLLELLIVIAIIAILSVALVIVLNPAETLRKARDAQRISDLSTLKTAIGLYLTSTAAPSLDGLSGGSINTTCSVTPGAARGAAGAFKIWYSLPVASVITDVALDGSTVVTPKVQVATPALTSGSGWIPVNFDSLTGGSPISNIPVDPVNTISALGGVVSTDLVYRYACSLTPLAFEIDSQLESTAYTVTDDKRASDGGNSPLYYETGTNLLILGAGGSAALDF